MNVGNKTIVKLTFLLKIQLILCQLQTGQWLLL